MSQISIIKKYQYYLIKGITMTGDAPKDFLGVYEYGYVPKSKCKKWSKYIAKHGHKYYPMESITEFLIYKIGKTLGYNVANAKLALVGGQIRFLSKYFITNICTQVLEHGADLYAGYLNNARQFVDDVEFKKLSHNFFTVQFTESVFKHFYNWGILKNIKNHVAPIFAPIYDTARGLFWNEFE